MCAHMVVLQPGVSISVIQVAALADKGQQPLGVLAAKGQQPLGVLAAKGQHPWSYTRGFVMTVKS